MAVRDVVQAAAGNAGGEATYVEDVFNTYLYTGNGSVQSIENDIALGDSNAGPCVPFNGSQYLSRTSDFVGNSDGSTFTLSFWAYVTNTYSTIFRSDTGRVEVLITNNRVEFDFKNTSGTSIWRGNSASNTALNYQWNHILISVDAGSNAKIYINDVSSAISYVSNTSGTFDFTATSWGIGAPAGGGYQPIQGRLTEFFFDKTYRNLGIEANRRLFITADGEPATGLASLNPLIYLPLNDTVSVGTNEGTGGDFVPINGLSSSETGGPYTIPDSGEGGMVWMKVRNDTYSHRIYDTERGVYNAMLTNSTAGQSIETNGLTAFNSLGFSLGNRTEINFNGASMASWTFRKAPKFFDVVTYTGNGVAGRTVAHNLGSDVGFLVVKRTNAAGNWVAWHRSLASTTNGFLYLNDTAAQNTSTLWNSTAPTSTEFTLGDAGDVNASGGSYVAYLFAHDAGGFGDDGDQNVISCGTYVGNSSGIEVNLGYEPQWIMVKKINSLGNWGIYDVLRGMPVYVAGVQSVTIKPNTSDAEASQLIFHPTATGFKIPDASGDVNGTGETYIYIAIRRGPMKVPESGTKVFAPIANNKASFTYVPTNFPIDLQIMTPRTGSNNPIVDRLRGISTTTYEWSALIQPTVANAESSSSHTRFWNSTGFTVAGIWGSTNMIYWNFRRAPSFFDMLAYTGDGSTDGSNLLTHNLSATPELIIIKPRTVSGSWITWHKDLGVDGSNRYYTMLLNSNGAKGLYAMASNSLTLTPSVSDTQIRVGGTNTNASGQKYISYTFASCPGVSKVGSYTGTGANLNVDCGFSAGARFVLIKRTDSTGDWYVWDSARGIVSGNDPYLLLNNTPAENTSTDYIDPLASGFTVTSSAPAALNVSGGSYIFLAIA